MVRFKERKGQKESSDKMKLINRILVLFCCCVCFICVGSMVAEKATVNAVEYVLRPYISFMRDIIGGQEQMGNILLGLGLMLSAGEIPRIAGAFGMDTSTKANLMSAVYTAQAAVNTTRTVVQAVTK